MKHLLQAAARSLAARLTEAGIHTTFLLVTALDLVMPEVTLVLLGCEVRPDSCSFSKVFLTFSQGVMANGCVLATVGTSQTALMAKSANKPVVVCCETYKFTPRVQTDSFVYNELSDPDDLVKLGPGQGSLLGGWRDQASLSLLNLVYDLTPATLVDSIITEISQIPPTRCRKYVFSRILINDFQRACCSPPASSRHGRKLNVASIALRPRQPLVTEDINKSNDCESFRFQRFTLLCFVDIAFIQHLPTWRPILKE